jgi:hypothetical protein
MVYAYSMPKRLRWPGQKSHKKLLPTHLLKQGKWFYLFLSLGALLLLYPYLEVSSQEQLPWLLALLNSIIVVLLVWAVSFNVRQFALILVFAVGSLAAEWMPTGERIELVRYVSRILLYGYALLMLIPYLLTHGHEEQGSDQIFAGTSTYVLIGLTWTGLYEVVEWFYPMSFHIPSEYNIDAALTWSDFLYFSFTTLTTLGYGDMVPVSSQARSLAILESCTGVLFLAVMIARTIGIYLVRALR